MANNKNIKSGKSSTYSTRRKITLTRRGNSSKVKHESYSAVSGLGSRSKWLNEHKSMSNGIKRKIIQSRKRGNFKISDIKKVIREIIPVAE